MARGRDRHAGHRRRHRPVQRAVRRRFEAARRARPHARLRPAAHRRRFRRRALVAARVRALEPGRGVRRLRLQERSRRRAFGRGGVQEGGRARHRVSRRSVGREGVRLARRARLQRLRAAAARAARVRAEDEEPAPYTKINPRPTEAQWADDPEHRARLGARAGRAGLPQRAARLPARPARGGAHQYAHLVDAARHRPRGAHHAVVRAARGARDPRHLPAGLAAARHLHLHQHAAAAALLQRHGLARAARAVRGDRVRRRRWSA